MQSSVIIATNGRPTQYVSSSVPRSVRVPMNVFQTTDHTENYGQKVSDPNTGLTMPEKLPESFDQVEGSVNGVHDDTASRLAEAKLKRILSNRASALRARRRRHEYVADMENQARAWEARVAMLSPQVISTRLNQYSLSMENKRLNQRLCEELAKEFISFGEIKAKIATWNMLQSNLQRRVELEAYNAMHVNWELPISNIQAGDWTQQITQPDMNFNQSYHNISHQGNTGDHYGTCNIEENVSDQLLGSVDKYNGNNKEEDKGQEWSNEDDLLAKADDKWWEVAGELMNTIVNSPAPEQNDVPYAYPNQLHD